MTSKERSTLMSAASKLTPIVHIGKDGITPNVTDSIIEAITARELIKVEVNKNCLDDYRHLADTLAARTHSQLVQIIGRKIVLYKPAKEAKDRKFNIL